MNLVRIRARFDFLPVYLLLSGAGLQKFKRKPQGDGCTRTGNGVYGEMAVDLVSPFLHNGQAKVVFDFTVLQIKTLTIIRQLDDEGILGPKHLHFNPLGLGVLVYIEHGFLKNIEDILPNQRRQQAWPAFTGDVYLEVGLLVDHPGKVHHGADQIG